VLKLSKISPEISLITPSSISIPLLTEFSEYNFESISLGSNPAFSAKVLGKISKAWAYL